MFHPFLLVPRPPPTSSKRFFHFNAVQSLCRALHGADPGLTRRKGRRQGRVMKDQFGLLYTGFEVSGYYWMER